MAATTAAEIVCFSFFALSFFKLGSGKGRNWQLIFKPLHLTSPFDWTNKRAGGGWRDGGWRPVARGEGAGGAVGNFASHLLTVYHVVITVCCPLVYLPPEDIGSLLVTIGPNNQLSVCPLSDVIHITGLSPLGCPFSACDQSLPPSKQRQKQAFN